MKTYARIARRRIQASLRLRMETGHGVVPVMDDPVEDLPVEVIDLATGPFELRFPELARRRRRER
jgi:hypothetical protein